MPVVMQISHAKFSYPRRHDVFIGEQAPRGHLRPSTVTALGTRCSCVPQLLGKSYNVPEILPSLEEELSVFGVTSPRSFHVARVTVSLRPRLNQESLPKCHLQSESHPEASSIVPRDGLSHFRLPPRRLPCPFSTVR